MQLVAVQGNSGVVLEPLQRVRIEIVQSWMGGVKAVDCTGCNGIVRCIVVGNEGCLEKRKGHHYRG